MERRKGGREEGEKGAEERRIGEKGAGERKRGEKGREGSHLFKCD